MYKKLIIKNDDNKNVKTKYTKVENADSLYAAKLKKNYQADVSYLDFLKKSNTFLTVVYCSKLSPHSERK